MVQPFLTLPLTSHWTFLGFRFLSSKWDTRLKCPWWVNDPVYLPLPGSLPGNIEHCADYYHVTKAREQIIIHILRLYGFTLDVWPWSGWNQMLFFPYFILFSSFLSPVSPSPKRIFRMFLVPALSESIYWVADSWTDQFLIHCFFYLSSFSWLSLFYLYVKEFLVLRNILICLSSRFLPLELETE